MLAEQRASWRRELREFLKLCFTELKGYSIAEIADKTGLSTTTLYRLNKTRQVSTKLRFETVLAFGYAAGFSCQWTKRALGRFYKKAA